MVKNKKQLKVSLATATIGVLLTIVFAILFESAISNNNTTLMAYCSFIPMAIYVAEYLIICYGFKGKFGKDCRWTATLCNLPLLIEILVIVILREPQYVLNFIKWYSMLGITTSILILEWKIFSTNKK